MPRPKSTETRKPLSGKMNDLERLAHMQHMAREANVAKSALMFRDPDTGRVVLLKVSADGNLRAAWGVM